MFLKILCATAMPHQACHECQTRRGCQFKSLMCQHWFHLQFLIYLCHKIVKIHKIISQSFCAFLGWYLCILHACNNISSKWLDLAKMWRRFWQVTCSSHICQIPLHKHNTHRYHPKKAQKPWHIILCIFTIL